VAHAAARDSLYVIGEKYLVPPLVRVTDWILNVYGKTAK